MPADEGDDLARRARRLTESWPEDARVVAVTGADLAGDPQAVVALAEAASGDERVVLVNLAGPGLDRLLGVPEGAGLREVLSEGRGLREIATRPEGRPFLYLPAGGPRETAGADDDSARSLTADPRIRRLAGRLADRVHDTRGRLLLYLAAGDEGAGDIVGMADGVVRLRDDRSEGEDPAPPAAGTARTAGAAADDTAPPASREEALVAPEAPPRGRDGASADRDTGEAPGGTTAAPSTGDWGRHRRTRGPPWGRIALGLAGIAVLVGAWWLFAREAGRAGTAAGGPDAVADTPASTAREGGAPGGDTSPEGDAASGAGPDAAPGAGARAPDDGASARLVAAADSAPELPFSVLIASYANWPSARARLDRWSGPGEPLYFVAPTPVRGSLYYRLFAGALSGRASAEALMRRQVEAGRKDRAREWDVRPVGLAYRLGVYGRRTAATARVEELREQSVAAYVVPAAAGGDTAWQLYAGGFESPEAADALGEMLRGAGIEVELTDRRGLPPDGT